ncbi:hypothetical protein EJ06DRAFT_392735 [Trichodelitschia bisporula]|uniref:RRM domain-containing protein n=1 Tax=Trichodelitschia bisporula TaxID=703511 RepID=A0A6G1HZJ5_9PEZI|nr:hypothetical protein EJ06DRAFT_392735 [Trichodelitschia bisporula]
MAAMQNDKLNKSLDQIMSETRRPRRTRNAGKPTPAPVGGIKKAVKGAKKDPKVKATAGPTVSGEGKIIVSNLPIDVTEAQIKKVLLVYGKDGKSRGVATIIFFKHESAAKAAKELDGIKVDNRPMKIEVIVNAQEAPLPAPAKSLADRVAQPKTNKSQPKPATSGRAAAAAKGKAKGKGPRARAGNAGRAKPKTTEELDAEMADYWEAGTGPNGGDATMTTNGAAQPIVNDTGMEDEI